jgi:hypothetical protein
LGAHRKAVHFYCLLTVAQWSKLLYIVGGTGRWRFSQHRWSHPFFAHAALWPAWPTGLKEQRHSSRWARLRPTATAGGRSYASGKKGCASAPSNFGPMVWEQDLGTAGKMKRQLTGAWLEARDPRSGTKKRRLAVVAKTGERAACHRSGQGRSHDLVVCRRLR